MTLGRITFDTTKNFYDFFISPWLNIFCISMGIFSACLFAYISAIFLVGETRIDRERKMYVRFSKRAMLLSIVTGHLVFITAETEGRDLLREFLQSTNSIIALLLATAHCPVIWYFLNKKKNKTVYLRIGVGIQVTFILKGWFFIQFPVLIKLQGGQHQSFFNRQGPGATLRQLFIALIVGLVLVIPGFIYLFKVFKIKSN
ncbi:MAG: cytochrome d ubiquinol oxidase subunit II [Ginsengibacter sp.]